MMTKWTNPDLCGWLVAFLDDEDPREAKEQLHARYAHGGGWQPFKGFSLIEMKQDALGVRGDFLALKYPEDPPMKEIGRTQLRDETVVLFEGSWVAIVQKTGEWEVARID